MLAISEEDLAMISLYVNHYIASDARRQAGADRVGDGRFSAVDKQQA
jgi:hypothetical protein